MVANILIVDDEEDIRNLIQGILEDEGYQTRTASNSSKAYQMMSERPADLVILDIWLQGSEHDGIQILNTLKEKYLHIPVLMISGHGTIETAVSSIKQGAYDFIEKPFKSDRLLLMIKRALEAANLRVENDTLRKKLDAEINLIGSCSVTQNFIEILKRAAPTNGRILLTGEPGSGKEVAARFIHAHSSRQIKPFVPLSCANLQPDRLEVELFGAEEGKTGELLHTGVLEKASGGTLFLDEVADMPLQTQGKIVRVLQNQIFQRVGGDQDIEVDLRVIAATNKNLKEEIEKGNFREDLYYRLNVVPVQIPPLRQRAEDIEEIVQYFANSFSQSFGLNAPAFTKEAMNVLKTYQWPGNIRQLKNTIEWVLIMYGDNNKVPYNLQCLPPEIGGTTKAGVQASIEESSPKADNVLSDDFADMPLRDAREYFEKEYLTAQIHKFRGNISQTAKFVGMERSALHRKLKSLGIVYTEDEQEFTTSLNIPEKKKKAS
ncbi:MAG: sigma-54-dependent transcriptional regulator [Alphaproteobacteria bacterium]